MTEKRSMISMRLPDELMEQVDARAKNLGTNRTQWFENMLAFVMVNTYTKDKQIAWEPSYVLENTTIDDDGKVVWKT